MALKLPTISVKAVVVMLVFVAMAITVIAVVVLKKSPAQEQPTPVVTEEKTEKKTCQYDDIICAFISSVNNKDGAYLGSLTETRTLTDADGIVTVTIARMDDQGNLDVQLTEDDKLQSHSVLVGGKQYELDTESKTWTILPSGEENLSDYRQESLSSVVEEILSSSVQKQPDEACVPLACNKFTLTNKEVSGVISDLYFETESQLLNNVMTKTEDGSTIESRYTYEKISPPIVAPKVK